MVVDSQEMEHRLPLTCLWRGRLVSLPGVLPPFAALSGKMGTCYLFIPGSGERESRFLGPVRACMAFQTSSLRLISVSRGSKPCRKKSRERVCRRGGRKGRVPSLLALPSRTPLVPSCWVVDIRSLFLYLFGDPEFTNTTLAPPPRQTNCLSAPEL